MDDPNSKEYQESAMRQMHSHYIDSDRVLAWFKPICDRFGYIPEPKDWAFVSERFKSLSLEERYRWIAKEKNRLIQLGWKPQRERVI